MTIRIKCNPHAANSEQLRVRVIKAPLVDNKDLHMVIFERARALVL